MKGCYLEKSLIYGSVLYALFSSNLTVAQVVGDTTLPAGERSQVSGNPNFQIDGGARRGGNLFHSFSEFSIPTGGSAFFNNAVDVQSILARVTSGSISNIDGLIQANGTANLFLLNPNGIIFGANASLNVGGSFVVTTADAIGLANGDIFTANPGQPLPSQLLNVNPNALFFNQLAAQSIINRSTANNGVGLQVPAGQSLLLVGGNVGLDGGKIISPGSRVELGAVAGQGSVGLIGTAGDWRLSFPDNVARSDISFSNSAIIDVRGGGGGSIAVTAKNLTLNQSSLLRAGINRGLGFAGAQAGDIQIDATEAINLADDSGINNEVSVRGTGNAGNINITTGSLSFKESAFVFCTTRGQGNGGSINIDARDTISLDGTDTGIFITVQPSGVGKAGDLNITTGSLSLTGDASLATGIFGQGDLGSVNINARDTVSLDESSAVFNIVDETGIGNAGGINIKTRSLVLAGGSQLLASTSGQGNAGSVNINVQDRVSIDGESPDGVYASGVYTRVRPGAVGQGGDVTITTGSVSLTNGGSVSTINFGGTGNSGRVTIQARDSVQIRGTASTNSNFQSGVFTSTQGRAVGNGGAVSITTGWLSVSDQGRITTSARAQGNAGNIQIQASGTVSFDRGDALSTLEPSGSGRGGNIEIEARSLSVVNNAQLSASTSGNGDAGNITVSADTISLNRGGRLLTTTFSSGQAGNITVNTPDLQLSGADSGLFAQTTTAADAGNLTIQPRDNAQSVRVNLQDGAQISASTSSSGRGGTLTITAPDSISLTGNGSVIAAGTGSSGAGGNLNLTTDTLNIQNQAQVTVSSSGTGRAGSLEVDANQIYLDNQGRISADTTGGGGNINLRSPLILLRNGSSITTNARGSNIPGGNINIVTDNLVAVPKENSDITANSEDFRGGNIIVRASGIFGIDFREQLTPLSDITATGVSEAFSGTVEFITPGIDPARGLAGLPTEVVDASDAIAQGCRDVRGSSFVVSGRGGLPPTPEQSLGDDPRWRDWRTPAGVSRQPIAPGNATLLPSANPANSKSALVEATGWVIEADGKVILTASAPHVTSPNRWEQPVNCDGS